MERIVVLERRIVRLERLARAQLVVIVAGLAFASFGAWSLPAGDHQQSGVLRVRELIVTDGEGRDRIILGAPVPDPADGRRASASVGLVINDTAGYERFGLGLHEDGDMTMGFDAPPGTGDPRNRERLTMGADATGGAHLRLVDRRTLVPFLLHLDEADDARLEFLRFGFENGKPTSVTRRQLDFDGWQTIEQPM